MKLLISLVVSTLVLSLFEKAFKKRPYLLYIGALVIGIVLMQVPNSYVSSFITRGTLATSLFIIVMYARVLPVKSRFYKTFMSLRAPIAIAGSFLIFLHNGKTLYSYIRAYVLYGTTLKFYERYAACCSVVMFALLLPLTITSFMPVRKRMNSKKWKKLQQTSYIFYALIYCHVAFLFGYQVAKGRSSYCIDLAIYTFIFGNYLFQRVGLYLKNKKKATASRNLKICGTSFVTVLSLFLLGIGGYNQFAGVITESEIAVEVAAIPSEASEANTVETEESGYIDGEYIGEGEGYNGTITVKVIITEGVISEIKIIDYEDDEDYFGSAWEVIPKEIISNQSVEVDSVSGATFSSKGIKKAVENALINAK